MLWYVDKTHLWKTHFTGDSAFDIMEGDALQRKQLDICRFSALVQIPWRSKCRTQMLQHCPLFLPTGTWIKTDAYFIASYLFNFFIKHSEEFLLAFRDVHAEKQRQSISTNSTFSISETLTLTQLSVFTPLHAFALQKTFLHLILHLCAGLEMVTSIHAHPEETWQPTAFPWARKAPCVKTKCWRLPASPAQSACNVRWRSKSQPCSARPLCPTTAGQALTCGLRLNWVTPETIHINQICSTKRLSI